MNRYFTAAVLFLAVSTNAFAQSPAEYRVTRTTTPPRIDGVLDDAAWTAVAPMPTGQWVSYNPNRGDKMPDIYRTEVRITYDDRNVYFAFHCFDNEPDKIRTTVAERCVRKSALDTRRQGLAAQCRARRSIQYLASAP
jgi:hypothetical protein